MYCWQHLGTFPLRFLQKLNNLDFWFYLPSNYFLCPLLARPRFFHLHSLPVPFLLIKFCSFCSSPFCHSYPFLILQTPLSTSIFALILHLSGRLQRRLEDSGAHSSPSVALGRAHRPLQSHHVEPAQSPSRVTQKPRGELRISSQELVLGVIQYVLN